MIWMDILDDSPPPKRGDLLRSPGTTYYVLHSRRVKRKDPNAPPRYTMFTAKMQDLEPGLRARLLTSAMRRGGSYLFEFQWYPRTKKRMTFEQYMHG